jgi:hypothetical protein
MITYLSKLNRKIQRGGDEILNDEYQKFYENYIWIDQTQYFDTYVLQNLKIDKQQKYTYLQIFNWDLRENERGKGRGSYQLMYLLFTSINDYIIITASISKFWNKFVQISEPYDKLEEVARPYSGYVYPTLQFLTRQKRVDDKLKLYKFARPIVDKLNNIK